MLGLQQSTLPSAGSTTTVAIPAGIHNGNGGVTVSYSGGNVTTAIPAGIHNGNGYMTVNGPSKTALIPQTWTVGSISIGRTKYKGRQDCTYGTQYEFVFNPSSGATYGNTFGELVGGTIVSKDEANNIIIVRATAAKVGFSVEYSDKYAAYEKWYDVTAIYKLP